MSASCCKLSDDLLTWHAVFTYKVIFVETFLELLNPRLESIVYVCGLNLNLKNKTQDFLLLNINKCMYVFSSSGVNLKIAILAIFSPFSLQVDLIT